MNRACYNQIQLQNRNVILEGDIFWLRGKSGRDEIWNYNRLMLINFLFWSAGRKPVHGCSLQRHCSIHWTGRGPWHRNVSVRCSALQRYFASMRNFRVLSKFSFTKSGLFVLFLTFTQMCVRTVNSVLSRVLREKITRAYFLGEIWTINHVTTTVFIFRISSSSSLFVVHLHSQQSILLLSNHSSSSIGLEW